MLVPDDPDAVAEGIKQLLGNEKLRTRMGAAGRRTVEHYYNWVRVARDFIDKQFRLTSR